MFLFVSLLLVSTLVAVEAQTGCPDVRCSTGCCFIYNNTCPECRCDAKLCEIVKCPPGTEGELSNVPCATGTCPVIKCVPSSATCSCHGDPHCMTFDGAGYWDYQGTYEYILTQSINNFQPAFVVKSKNQLLPGYTQVSFVEYVDVTIDNENIRMQRDARGLFEIIVKDINNQVIPFNTNPLRRTNYNLYDNMNIVSLTTEFGLTVEYSNSFSLTIVLKSSLRRRVEGYCGNYNGNLTDDSFDRQGRFWPNIGHATGGNLGASWVTCNTSRCLANPNTVVVLQNCPIVRDRCQQIINTNGIFRDCINIITLPVANKIYETCVYDANVTCSDQVVCAAMEAFVSKCQAVGVVVPWRGVTKCPCKCSDPNAVCPSEKVSACPATCSDPLQTRPCKAAQLYDVCVCKPGFVLSGGLCVPQTQCPCVDETGAIRKIGEQWLSANCTTLYTCKSGGVGGIVKQPNVCPSRTACIAGACSNPCTTVKCPKLQECQVQCFNPLCQPARAACVKGPFLEYSLE